MKKIIATISFIFLLIITMAPIFSYAALPPATSLYMDTVAPQTTSSASYNASLDYSGWVQCDGVVAKNNAEPNRKVPCTFVNLIVMVNHLINWAFMISVPVIVGLLAYAGFLHMTGKEANIKKSYQMFWSALLGLVVMLTAWFLVTTAISWIAAPWAIDSASTLTGQKK